MRALGLSFDTGDTDGRDTLLGKPVGRYEVGRDVDINWPRLPFRRWKLCLSILSSRALGDQIGAIGQGSDGRARERPCIHGLSIEFGMIFDAHQDQEEKEGGMTRRRRDGHIGWVEDWKGTEVGR